MLMAELIPAELSDQSLVKPSEVAVWLGVNVVTVYDWSKKGRLPQPMSIGPKTRKYRVGELRAALRKLEEKPVRKKRR